MSGDINYNKMGKEAGPTDRVVATEYRTDSGGRRYSILGSYPGRRLFDKSREAEQQADTCPGGEPAYRMFSVRPSAFFLYLSFLQTNNSAQLIWAQREFQDYA